MIKQTLKKLGLKDKEIQIYLAILPLGSVPASILGKRTGMNRSTAQYICQQLVQKGLLTVIEKNGNFVYSVESPENILLLLERQKSEIEEKQTQANKIIETCKKLKELDDKNAQVRAESETLLVDVMNDFQESMKEIMEPGALPGSSGWQQKSFWQDKQDSGIDIV